MNSSFLNLNFHLCLLLLLLILIHYSLLFCSFLALNLSLNLSFYILVLDFSHSFPKYTLPLSCLINLHFLLLLLLLWGTRYLFCLSLHYFLFTFFTASSFAFLLHLSSAIKLSFYYFLRVINHLMLLIIWEICCFPLRKNVSQKFRLIFLLESWSSLLMPISNEVLQETLIIRLLLFLLLILRIFNRHN